jgi:aspartyl-tRNA(Asn)/glutamyl-tRNA(Gln) amidotransferase subunit A
MTDFRRDRVVDLAASVRAGHRSARELTEQSLAAIEQTNAAVNAFVAVDGDRALREAAAIDQIVASGGDPGPLAGIPLGVKDLEDVAGYRTTHGTPLFADSPPATADSPLVARLRAAGCVVVGKTNTSELACTANTTNDLFGPTNNPWHLGHSPGGSSGGSAAAVAAGMVPLTTGSDGGGSIRIPSSCCGLSGMKPSLGRVPAGGAEPPGWLDLSTKGVMARRMADVVAALDVAVGPEPTDLRSLPRPEASWPAVLDEPRVPSRIAWSPTLGYATADAEVLEICERAVGALESLGAEIVPVDSVFDEDPVGPWLTMVAACTLRSVGHHRNEPAWDRVDPFLRGMVDGAASTTAVELIAAIDQCHRMNLTLVDLFHGVRLLVTPTVAAEPPPLALDGAGLVNGEVDWNWVKFTYPFNMTRSPAATICAGLTANGLPVGLQLVGPQHADLVVLRSAAALELALGFDEVASAA